VARARKASKPVADTWLALGDVQFVDYEGDRFDPAKLSRQLGQLILSDTRAYTRVNVYAESMGCFLVADALRDVAPQFDQGAKDGLRLVFGDCPSGAESISPFSGVTTFFHPGPVYNAMANVAVGFFRVAGIDQSCSGSAGWSWSATCSTAAQIAPYTDARAVQREQLDSSSGFPLSVFADQVRYIRSGVPDAAGLRGLPVTYLMSQPEHDITVIQPVAAHAWTAALREAGADVSLVELDFPSNHCEYFTWPTEWNALFASVLA
jgi:hypothetical protein